MRKLAFVFLAVALPLAAQARSSDVQPRPFPLGLVALIQGWRTHSGDNLTWAQPGFDDSAWQPAILSSNVPLPAGHRWYRLRMHLSEGDSPVALQIVAPSGSFEVWIDGRRIPGFAIGSWLRMSSNREFVIPLPPHESEMEIALRVSFPPYLANTYGGALSVSVGGVAAAEAQARAGRNRRILDYMPTALFNLAIVLAGIAALVLFLAQRPRPEYLWLGLYFVFLALSTAFWRAASDGLLPYWVNSLFADPIEYPVLAWQIEFSFAFINRRVSRGWRGCEAGLFAAFLLAFLTAAGFLPATAYWLVEAAVAFGVGFGLPILLFIQLRRGNREAGLLILPSLLPAAVVAINDIGTVAAPMGLGGLIPFDGWAFSVGPVKILAVDLADVGFLLAIGILLLIRFTQVSRQQAHAAAELEAAQRVQSLLLRRTQCEASGTRIEVVYRPAQEVGGDFFHTSQIDGATRIVVGDVSGKGMGAAMLVSVLLGALDSIPDGDPVAVLQRLNAIMLARQQGGFVTCLCARITPNGTIALANAGHLAPYRNGEELALPPGLPLGIDAGMEYSETTVRLVPGDTLTFLSDGVVEAQSPSGELFGFERTCAISTQSAESIARAAQAFGQQDDITVLSLQFTPVEVVHA